MSDRQSVFLSRKPEPAPRPYIHDTAPLVCLILYINLTFDDEKRRVELVNHIFRDFKDTSCMENMIGVVYSREHTKACYQAAAQAVQEGRIERFDPDFGVSFSDDEGQDIEKVYIVSFLAWAEQAGYSLPEYVMSDLDTFVNFDTLAKLYFSGKSSRATKRRNFPKITKEEFERRINEPLWMMTDALLCLLGYKNKQNQEEKIRFLRKKKKIEEIRKYALDAQKIEELELYDYKSLTEGNVPEEREKAFFTSKVKPKDFVKWVQTMPMDFPVLKEYTLTVTQTLFEKWVLMR